MYESLVFRSILRDEEQVLTQSDRIIYRLSRTYPGISKFDLPLVANIPYDTLKQPKITRLHTYRSLKVLARTWWHLLLEASRAHFPFSLSKVVAAKVAL